MHPIDASQTTISDVIQIEPSDFYKPSGQALEDNINHKYANKVIQKVGLCICFFDLLEASDGLIGHGDGLVNVNAKFRIIVFRPFKGEIIEGTIIESSPTGIRISLDFLDTIHIPCPTNIFQPSHFDPVERVWIWTNEVPIESAESAEPPHDAVDNITSTEDAAVTTTTTTTKTPFYFDRHERVRFRVESEIWTDLAPVGPVGLGLGLGSGSEGRGTGAGAGVGKEGRGVNGTGEGKADGRSGGVAGVEGAAVKEGGDGEGKTRTPWRIVGSMQQGGLGVTSWW